MGLAARGRRVGLGAFFVVGVACSSSGHPSAPVDAGSSGPTTVGPLATNLLDDPTGDLIAKAAAEHVPTSDEVKLIAVYWAGTIVTTADGSMPDEFIEADLPDAVLPLAAKYPSFFPPFGMQTSALSTPSDTGASAPCGDSCLTTQVKAKAATDLVECLGVVGQYRTIAKLLSPATETVSKARALWNTFKDAYDTGSLGAGLGAAVWTKIDEGSAYDLVKAVVDVSLVVGAAAASAEAAPIVAIVAANVAILECGLDVGKDIHEFQICRVQKAACPDGTAADGGADGDGPSDGADVDANGEGDGNVGSDGASEMYGSDPIPGDWNVSYGSPAVVTISGTSSSYTMTAKTAVQVTGAPCSLPSGTEIATFSGSGTSYSGQHGLWLRSDCSFSSFTTLTLTLAGTTLSEALGNGERHVLTKVVTGAQ